MAESREVSESDRAPGRQRHRAGEEPDGDSLRKELEKLSLEGGKRPHREWWKSEDFLRETTEEERELWAELERQREEDHKLQGEFRDLVRRKDEITCAMWRTRERIRIMYQHKGKCTRERKKEFLSSVFNFQNSLIGYLDQGGRRRSDEQENGTIGHREEPSEVLPAQDRQRERLGKDQPLTRKVIILQIKVKTIIKLPCPVFIFLFV